MARGEVRVGSGHRPGRRDDPEREFEQLFDAVWPRSLALGARMGLGREEAEDVALDGLAIAYDRWTRVRGLQHREAWVLKVTSNLALRRLKKRRAAPADRDWAPSAEHEVTTRMVLQDALAALPRRQRQVVTLRYLADLPEAEVANALRMDVGSVKQHASRGRAALRGVLTVNHEEVGT